ncbi:MAG TPA: hypothetical protein VIM18_04440 [Solirubrobacteraceae bacterium]
MAGDHAGGGLAAAAQLDEHQVLDPRPLGLEQLIGIALVGVARDAVHVGLHPLREGVAEREVVARCGRGSAGGGR